MKDKIKCFFGFHEWENIDTYKPHGKKGETVCYSSLHKCKCCKKEELKGMGCIQF